MAHRILGIQKGTKGGMEWTLCYTEQGRYSPQNLLRGTSPVQSGDTWDNRSTGNKETAPC